jgi:serine-type D-Ala-D-Ala carboxypeptidase (penicillin-binding protein 5/6)
LTPNPNRGRSGWVGFTFLGLSMLIGLGTLFLALTDRSLADVTNLEILGAGNESSTVNEASLTPVPTPTPEPEPPLVIDEDLELTAQAAYVVHADTGEVLYEEDADVPLQPASTAKIFTALVVLEYASPQEVIDIEESDVVDPVAESAMGLEAGDRVTVHDLIVGLMLPSGNDAANALSRTIGERIEGAQDESSNDRFLREMNRIAEDLGLEETNLQHAAGHDQDDQQITARELAIGAEALMQRPSLMTIVAMHRAEIKVGGDNARVLTVDNTNELLVHHDVFGVKTGTTSEAGQCLVVASRHGDETVISVILGSEDRYEDASVLLDLPELPEPADDMDDEPDPEHTDPITDSATPEAEQ